MKLVKTPFKVAALSVSLLLSSFAWADEVKGLEIAQERKARDEGWGDSVATMQMILRNAQGESSTRLMRLKSLEVADDGDKGLTIFDEPRDVKGTAFLNHSHTVGADDQWLYLPALKRVKRIASRNKSGPFMGSEFAYEDLSSQEVEKYTYKFIEEKGGLLIVEQDPVDPKSGYTRRLVSYNKDKGYRIEKVEFYDRKNALLKTLTYSDYKLYKDKYWRASVFTMINHQSNKETRLDFNDYNFDVNLTEDDFTQVALKRAGK